MKNKYNKFLKIGNKKCFIATAWLETSKFCCIAICKTSRLKFSTSGHYKAFINMAKYLTT